MRHCDPSLGVMSSSRTVDGERLRVLPSAVRPVRLPAEPASGIAGRSPASHRLATHFSRHVSLRNCAELDPLNHHYLTARTSSEAIALDRFSHRGRSPTDEYVGTRIAEDPEIHHESIGNKGMRHIHDNVDSASLRSVRPPVDRGTVRPGQASTPDRMRDLDEPGPERRRD